nr:MAG TPA: hypothetical protein [Caudoviricetes sp.]
MKSIKFCKYTAMSLIMLYVISQKKPLKKCRNA